MKLSISLPESDVEFVDEYVSTSSAESRSAVIHAAIEMLRAASMEREYAAAFDEWDSSEDGRLWEAATADGMAHEAR